MDYTRPIIIKKKPAKARKKRRKDTGQFLLPPANHNSDRLFIGEFILGQFAKNYPECSTNFTEFEIHSHVAILCEEHADVLAIMWDNVLLYAIVLQVDTDFILNLLKTKQFYFRLCSIEDNVAVKIYFKNEPSEKQQVSWAKRQSLKQLFQLLFNVGVSSISETDKKKNCQDDVDQALQSIRTKQLELLENTASDSSNFQQSKWLKSTLRAYQQSGVQWMLNKEKTAQNVSDNIKIPHPNYVEVKLPAMNVYFEQTMGYIMIQPPMLEVSMTGGILADEMGLGKTIEVLALILSDFDSDQENSKGGDNNDEQTDDKNQKLKDAEIQIHRQRKRPIYVVEDIEAKGKQQKVDTRKNEPVKTRDRLKQLYESVLVSVWDIKVKEEQVVACICGSFVEKNLKTCVDCGKKQHYNCVGYDKTCGPFRCSQCWSKQDPLPSKATLIVCPASLCQQWINEITKHISCNLQVFYYDGSSVLTPVYPTKLATYDIIVTTYTVLQSEFYLADQVCTNKSLRHQRKYSSPGSPITLVKFRRVCLDEAQTVESPSSMIAAMAQRLRADFRWAITGTPVTISISDLYGLVEYLHLAPYNDPELFNNVLFHPYLRGEETHLVNFLAEVLWRTRKCDVLDQINIPPQTFKYHFINFSQVEGYFYDCETHEAKNLFLERSTKLDASTLLMKMSPKELKGLLQPISALRRVCVHHNVAKGKYLLSKKPVNSMQQLLDALIARNMSDCDEHLRVIVGGNNGLAGVYLLLSNPLSAAMHYYKVIELEKKYEKKDGEEGEGVTIDKLPLIHMYYNFRLLVNAHQHLATNLSAMFGTEVVLSLDDMKTRQDMLEHAYIRKFDHQTRQVLQALGEVSNNFLDIETKITVKSWYADMIAVITTAKLKGVLSKRLDSILEGLPRTEFRSVESFNIEYVLQWIESIQTLREAAMTSVSDLYEISNGERITFTTEIIEETVNCHLRPEKTSKKKKVTKQECHFCATSKLLQQYEEVLYRKELSECGKQKNWFPSPQEQIIAGVLKVASRKANEDVIQSGKTFMELLDVQKKEFRELRKMWTYLESQLCANDEIAMCKTRLQLTLNTDEDDDEPVVHRSLRQLSNEIKNNFDGINQLTEYEIDGYRCNLEGELNIRSTLLDKCLGTNKYLSSLYSNKKMDPCPICRGPLEKSWNMLRCGHAYCFSCMETIVGQNKVLPRNSSQKITCAICRQVQLVKDVHCIDETLSKSEQENQSEKVIGNCSTKVAHIVRLINQLKKKDPEVKVLVFTSFIAVLQILKDIFEQNNINTVMISSNPQVDKKVERFKQKDVTALVLPVNLGSKGLNLIEATHVIFAEPILDPAEELQAIGRVHRIGQKKETVVHKFIMNDSIEAGIQRATSSKEKSKWSRAEITVGKLQELLFGCWDTEDELTDMVDD